MLRDRERASGGILEGIAEKGAVERCQKTGGRWKWPRKPIIGPLNPGWISACQIAELVTLREVPFVVPFVFHFHWKHVRLCHFRK